MKIYQLTVIMLFFTTSTTFLFGQNHFQNDSGSVKAIQEALQMINVPAPTFQPFLPKENDKPAPKWDWYPNFEYVTKQFQMRDGKHLFAYHYEKESETFYLVEKTSHNDIQTHQEAIQHIKTWAIKHQLVINK